jgi:hypothetical protein
VFTSILETPVHYITPMKINRVFTRHSERSEDTSIFNTLECHYYCISLYRPLEIRHSLRMYKHPVTPNDTQRSKPRQTRFNKTSPPESCRCRTILRQPEQICCKLGVSVPHCKWVGHEERHLATGVVVVLSSLYPPPPSPFPTMSLSGSGKGRRCCHVTRTRAVLNVPKKDIDED